MFSPMNVEIVGDIVSDNKLRLVKNIDNVEVFRSEMAFDAKKKFEISTEVNAGEFLFFNLFVCKIPSQQ